MRQRRDKHTNGHRHTRIQTYMHACSKVYGRHVRDGTKNAACLFVDNADPIIPADLYTLVLVIFFIQNVSVNYLTFVCVCVCECVYFSSIRAGKCVCVCLCDNQVK